MTIPVLAAGGYNAYYKQSWPLYKEIVFNLFGATTTILPLIPPEQARTATTHVSWPAASGSSQTVTWDAAPSSDATYIETPIATRSVWTAPGMYGPAGIPGIKFNGTSDGLTIPDADYWTRAGLGFTVIACVTAAAASGTPVIMGKWTLTSGREWLFRLNSAAPQLLIGDESAGVFPARLADAAMSLGVPHHVVITKSTANGATAMDDAIIYVDGALVASTATNSGSFVDMENGTGLVAIGHDKGDTGGAEENWFSDIIFGGPFGPTFIQAVITAGQVLRHYHLWREAMGLGR